MINLYEELGLSESMDTAELLQELNKLESLWRRREVTNPEKAAKMIACIMDARNEFKDEATRKKYDMRLEQSKQKPEEQNPNMARLQSFTDWMDKANSFYESEQFDLAQSALEKAISYMPADYEDSEFFNNAARIYLDNNNCHMAMDYINKAIIFDNDNPDYYLTKGLIYNDLASERNISNADGQSYQLKSEETFLKAREIATRKNIMEARAKAAGALACYYYSENNEREAETFAQEAIDYGDTWGNGKKVLQIITERKEAREREHKEQMRRQEEAKKRQEEENKRAEEERRRREEEKREEERKRIERETEIAKKDDFAKKFFVIACVLSLIVKIWAIFLIQPFGAGGFEDWLGRKGILAAIMMFVFMAASAVNMDYGFRLDDRVIITGLIINAVIGSIVYVSRSHDFGGIIAMPIIYFGVYSIGAGIARVVRKINAHIRKSD